MTPTPAVVLVIPCYNEGHRIDLTAFDRCLADQPGVSIVMVDDGSTDATAARLEEWSQTHHARVTILRLPRNSGKGEAVRQGVLHARSRGEMGIIGFMDADLATPLEDVPLFCEAFANDPELRVVMGARILRLGAHVERRTIRHYVGRVFATVVSLMLDLGVYDTQCGAKFFRADTVDLLFREPFVSRWFFDVELLFRARAAWGVSVVPRVILELPVRTWVERSGSKLTPKDFLATPRELFRIWRHYRGRQPPLRGTVNSLGRTRSSVPPDV